MFAITIERDAAQQMPEQRLWMAVLARTVQEWASGPLRSRREAGAYLFQDETDFPDVCRAAGLDPATFRSRLRRFERTAGAAGGSAPPHN